MSASWRESGLWELLRYVIPGLVTILYTFAFLYAFIGMHGFRFEYFIKNNFSTIAFLIPLLALPIGYLVYEICLAFEYEDFLGRRGGREVVDKIYREMYKVDDPLELKLESIEENKKEFTVAKINEIMDIIFFKYEKKLGGDISRVVMVFMSTLTVVKYAPICAFFLSIISIFYFDFSHLCISFFHAVFHMIFLVLLFETIYWITDRKIIGKSGFLKKNLDELERNTLLLGECRIRRLIRMKSEFKLRKKQETKK